MKPGHSLGACLGGNAVRLGGATRAPGLTPWMMFLECRWPMAWAMSSASDSAYRCARHRTTEHNATCHECISHPASRAARMHRLAAGAPASRGRAPCSRAATCRRACAARCHHPAVPQRPPPGTSRRRWACPAMSWGRRPPPARHTHQRAKCTHLSLRAPCQPRWSTSSCTRYTRSLCEGSSGAWERKDAPMCSSRVRCHPAAAWGAAGPRPGLCAGCPGRSTLHVRRDGEGGASTRGGAQAVWRGVGVGDHTAVGWVNARAR